MTMKHLCKLPVLLLETYVFILNMSELMNNIIVAVKGIQKLMTLLYVHKVMHILQI